MGTFFTRILIGIFLAFFLYLIFLMARSVSPTKKEAHAVVISANVVWGLLMLVFIFISFSAIMIGGGPNAIEIPGLMTFLSFFSLIPLTLYSLVNVGLQYRMENYRNVVYYASIPFAGIFLFVISSIINR